jgi:2-polyprenyl-3-methyl-5-hydroxy-6-metoxy-1,4-benzoquinol methylase
MARKHPTFDPWFRRRAVEAVTGAAPSAVWTHVVDRLPEGSALSDLARRRAHQRYLRLLAPRFLDRWASEEDLADLRAYLGEAFDERKLREHLLLVESEEEQAPDDATFYRTSTGYLYDLTVFAMSGTKVPYREVLASLVPPRSRLLDYGCGIGTDGLRLARLGYEVAFADFDNPSTRYLRWRLDRRGLDAPVHDIDGEVPGGFDLAYSFDVIEHVDDPFAFLAELERRARVVAVNFLSPAPNDTHLHKPLPIPALLDHAERRGLIRYRLYHGRSHLVIYSGEASPLRRARGRLERRVGAKLPGSRF